MPIENAPGPITEFFKYGWLLLVAVVTYMWKQLSGQVDKNSEALTRHKLDDQKSHEVFVTKSDFRDTMNSLVKRFDKLDDNDAEILKHLMEGVSRAEFKGELSNLYTKVDSLEQRKADK